MGNFVFNISKGRVAELFNRVDSGDPSTCRLFVDTFSGAVVDDTLNNADTIADAVTAGLTRLTTNGWGTKTLAAADITMAAPDDTGNTMSCDIADQTWTSVSSGNSTRLIISYAAVTSPTTAQMVPLTCHDFAVTADGSDVTAVIDTAGFYRAS